jgi:hypothetical protein
VDGVVPFIHVGYDEMGYRHLPAPDFHRLDCQHYGLREHEQEQERGEPISQQALTKLEHFK